ncbi:multidrug ABC transporter [Acetobacter nitrogenifigens DSM 23921 = NBRC 105050]|uniref:Multidrug export protein EmrA n=1 Tax=Acetobacter nitrogenifigens DSM 23921 = NBRC 105050 TaxID=1120919 RepID=A0A511X6T8_9PROT|nr:HlyD family secretion protein [Acetobacter nitrogenifigens]GBQ98811.1 multidrug ABC transporter [Acetobacter nitrogenifigens DSM 23921 = NBRC 105050]GEN58641.1 multidrug export protein EmrA [Acetobacter nitrogenifigens DSM 23921 = NBRC 105050]
MADEIHDHDSPGAGASGSTQAAPKKKRNPLVRILLIGLLVLAVIGAALYWFLHRFDVETDDAFTQGRAITIAPHVSGYVTELLVDDNQFVRAGQLLARIDPRDWQAARDKAAAAVSQAEATVAANQMLLQVAEKNFPGRLLEAQANLASAKAQEFRAETDYKRQHSVMRDATSQQDIDYSQAALDAAKAQVMQAQAQVAIAEPVAPNIGNARAQVNSEDAQLSSAKASLVQADLNLLWTEIRAPHDGWISQRNIERGNFVSSGQTLFSIVTPEVWVIANYKETQITSMRPGQAVDITVDAYPDLKLHGHVDSLQKGTGATFSAFPPENATGNYVKIVQRVPVKIRIDSGLDRDAPLALGLSVVPTVHVDTKAARSSNGRVVDRDAGSTGDNEAP